MIIRIAAGILRRTRARFLGYRNKGFTEKTMNKKIKSQMKSEAVRNAKGQDL